MQNEFIKIIGRRPVYRVQRNGNTDHLLPQIKALLVPTRINNGEMPLDMSHPDRVEGTLSVLLSRK